MNFYNTTHQHYCGIDLHARSLYVCILNGQGETLLHKEIPASPEALLPLLEPYRDDLVIGVGGGNSPLAHVYPNAMRSTRDLLRRRTNLVRHGADLKAHVVNTTSQYNLPPNKVNLKNVSSREQLKSTFEDPMVQRNIDLDMAVLDCYQRELKKVEWLLEKQARQHKPTTYYLLQTIPGIGRILALTINHDARTF